MDTAILRAPLVSDWGGRCLAGSTPEARWQHPRAPVCQLVDHAMAGIEGNNRAVKGVLPKNCVRPTLVKTRIGQLRELIHINEASRAKDVLAHVYEYFLSQFASAEGGAGRRVRHGSLRGRDARAVPLPGERQRDVNRHFPILSDGEFRPLMDDIVTQSALTAAHTRYHYPLTRSDGTSPNFALVNLNDSCRHTVEVGSQLRINTDHRYGLLLMTNGVPCEEIELKTWAATQARRPRISPSTGTIPATDQTRAETRWFDTFCAIR